MIGGDMKESRLKAVQRQLREIGDESIARHSAGFFKTGKGGYAEGDRFLGIRVPVLRKLVKEYPDLTLPQMTSLLRSKYHEERLLAVLMLVAHYNKSDDSDKQRIYDLYLKNTRYINNWDLVDSSAEHIVGAYLMGRDKAPIYTLSHAESLWERRISIMSTYHFIKKNEFRDTLRISKILLNDKEDLIHKAVGWMLREIGKRDVAKLEGFLKAHYQKMPRTMLRYAIEKFPEKKRQGYLNGLF
jgi:3-methyladenine DNA glycosylase AlkD